MKKITTLISYLRSINYIKVSKELFFFSKFFLLVIIFLIFEAVKFMGNRKWLFFWAQPLRKPVVKIRSKSLYFFNTREAGEISSLDLITLAVRHLTAKKTRTIITIGGMSIGFGSVIFLLSLGYGTQKLVISRVARLGELRQAIVTVGQTSSLKINDAALQEFENIESVEAAMPLASVVSKVNYNNSISDAIAYAVTKKFLEESAIQPVKGNIFEDGTVSTSNVPIADQGQVAGIQTERISGAKMNKQISEIKYSIYPQTWKPVYKEPSTDAEIIGYTSRVVGELNATEVWGQEYPYSLELLEGYDSFGNTFFPWIKDTYPIWKKEKCNLESYECVEGEYIVVRDTDKQTMAQGYITHSDVIVERYTILSSSNPDFVEGEAVETIEFTLPVNSWKQTYSGPSKDEESVTLYTTQEKSSTIYTGELVFGESYYHEDGWGSAAKNSNGKNLGYWIKAKVPLWRKVDCQDCANLFVKEVDENGKQIEALSFIRADVATIDNMSVPLVYETQSGSVLGIASESAQLESDEESSDSSELADITAADGSLFQSTLQEDGTIDWVSISSTSGSLSTQKRELIPFASDAQKVAVVNRALLSVFNIPESDAIGQTFTTTFMLDEEFFNVPGYQAESEAVVYTIIGVIANDSTPSYYVPFSDIKSLGIENYSQAKIVVKNQDDLKAVRQTIESLGYKTSSVVDTVGRINTLFGTVRLVLSVLGFVALSVAALGMFNTLTVSLLEKTREVGLMKAIGMKSNEIQRLFLAESIVMGLTGGIFGLLLGSASGHLLSFLFSVVSVTSGLGYINLVSIPFGLAVGIISLSFVIGILTGLYPSHRATKISALNALRYE